MIWEAESKIYITWSFRKVTLVLKVFWSKNRPIKLTNSLDTAIPFQVILMDATVATGAAAMMAIRVLLDHDVPAKNINLVSLLMAESGTVLTEKLPPYFGWESSKIGKISGIFSAHDKIYIIRVVTKKMIALVSVHTNLILFSVLILTYFENWENFNPHNVRKPNL